MNDLHHQAMRLKELRYQYGITQQELADQLDMSRDNLAQIETERHGMSRNTAKKIAEFFDVDWWTLYE